MRMRKRILSFLTVFLLGVGAFAQNNLIIRPEDIRLATEGDGTFEGSTGYHLYIRKKDGLGSVLLVETTKDPELKNENFAYRTSVYNPINGDEIRFLNGKRLDSPGARYSLIDSTTESDEEFGEAFHIYIPAVLEYGYPWTRNGVVRIQRGTFINIRAFEKPYADYSGAFADNPYMFDLGAPVKNPAPLPPIEPEREVAPPEREAPPPVSADPPPAPSAPVLVDDYNPAAVDAFQDIAGFGGGVMVRSKPETLVDDIMRSLSRIDPKTLVDVVFAIDTTGSMKDDVDILRRDLIPRLEAALKDYGELRIGLLLYRDYTDNYKYMGLPVKFYNFTQDIKQFSKHLNNFVIYGKEGGDIPEAVFEALWASSEFYKWRPDAQRKIVLIGDAEPHPTPRGGGKYTKEFVTRAVQKKGIAVDTIILPDDKSRRGR